MGKVEEYHFRKQTRKQLSRIESILQNLELEVIEMSVELDQLIVQVGETESVEESVITLLQGIKARIDELVAEELDLEATKAKLVELSTDLDASEKAVADAVANFTPPPPPVP